MSLYGLMSGTEGDLLGFFLDDIIEGADVIFTEREVGVFR